MSDQSDQIKLRIAEASYAVQATGSGVLRFWRNFPRWQQVVIAVAVLGLVPGYFAASFASHYVVSKQLDRSSTVAHPSFMNAQAPQVGLVTVIAYPGGQYAAVASLVNPNLDLAAKAVTYTAQFKNTRGEIIATSTGSTLLLPNQKKFIVVPRIESSDAPATGSITIADVAWQKPANLLTVAIRTPEPFLYDQANPQTLYAEGAIVNNSPYRLGVVNITFVAYDSAGKIVAVSNRTEQDVVANGRRAYRQPWPGLFRSQIARITVLADTDTLTASNVQLDVPSVPNSQPETSNNGF
jgi:hypothetical protein